MGTTYVQTGDLTWLALLGGVASGCLACAVLVTNNLRDIPTDTPAGKRTLAVRLGAGRTRFMYVGLLVVPFLLVVLAAFEAAPALLALVALPLAVPPVRIVRSGAVGPALIAVLKDTARLQLVFGVLLATGLALS
jgi:1,4-dihydroxy-2-naphthoate octaprenyltransferase